MKQFSIVLAAFLAFSLVVFAHPVSDSYSLPNVALLRYDRLVDNRACPIDNPARWLKHLDSTVFLVPGVVPTLSSTIRERAARFGLRHYVQMQTASGRFLFVFGPAPMEGLALADGKGLLMITGEGRLLVGWHEDGGKTVSRKFASLASSLAVIAYRKDADDYDHPLSDGRFHETTVRGRELLQHGLLMSSALHRAVPLRRLFLADSESGDTVLSGVSLEHAGDSIPPIGPIPNFAGAKRIESRPLRTFSSEVDEQIRNQF